MIRRHASQVLSQGLLALAVVYFLIHALIGPDGLPALRAHGEAVAAAETRLAALRSDNEALSLRLARLEPHDPDLDFVGELIRREFGYLRADERLAPGDPNGQPVE